MNRTTTGEARLRELTHRIARARAAAAQHSMQRETEFQRFGLAHPRVLAATKRMNSANAAHRTLLRMRSTCISQLTRDQAAQRAHF